jgi:hypothetical protein
MVIDQMNEEQDDIVWYGLTQSQVDQWQYEEEVNKVDLNQPEIQQ